MIPKNVINLVTVKNNFFCFSADILKNRSNLTGFFLYEKQPFIGEVHELIVEFSDDILTVFPSICVHSFEGGL